MSTVLGVPIRAANTTTIEHATDLELLIAFSNTLVWLLVGLFLYIQMLGTRRVEACLILQLENERRTLAELNRQQREIMEAWGQRLERIPEEDEEDLKQEGGVAGDPEQRLGLDVEDDLREAMEDELLGRLGKGSDSEDDDFDGLEMARMPARQQLGRERERAW